MKAKINRFLVKSAKPASIVFGLMTLFTIFSTYAYRILETFNYLDPRAWNHSGIDSVVTVVLIAVSLLLTSAFKDVYSPNIYAINDKYDKSDERQKAVRARVFPVAYTALFLIVLCVVLISNIDKGKNLDASSLDIIYFRLLAIHIGLPSAIAAWVKNA